MNNKKKLLSIITDLAITASAFTGFAVTASAENTDEQPISADSEITLADETTSTEVVTEDEQSEAVELADDSDVYFEQNYDAADASVDWVSPNMQSAITLVDDGNGGKTVDTTHLDNKTNSRGQYLLFGDLAAGSKYVVEFDWHLRLQTTKAHNLHYWVRIMLIKEKMQIMAVKADIY